MPNMLVTITPELPRPQWIRARVPVGDNCSNLKRLIDRLGLHTVCESAACPNLGECWNRGTATFMILGNVCTRRCGFCAVPKGAPLPVDYDEPQRVAEAVAAMGLRFAVVTSVNPGGQAQQDVGKLSQAIRQPGSSNRTCQFHYEQRKRELRATRAEVGDGLAEPQQKIVTIPPQGNGLLWNVFCVHAFWSLSLWERGSLFRRVMVILAMKHPFVRLLSTRKEKEPGNTGGVQSIRG
jgi:hypothetical protein